MMEPMVSLDSPVMALFVIAPAATALLRKKKARAHLISFINMD